MNKDQVYSWRLDAALKSAIEEASSARNTSMANLLDTIVRDWLARDASGGEDAEVQRRLHEAAAKSVGSICGSEPNRAREGRRRIRAALKRKYAG